MTLTKGKLVVEVLFETVQRTGEGIASTACVADLVDETSNNDPLLFLLPGHHWTRDSGGGRILMREVPGWFHFYHFDWPHQVRLRRFAYPMNDFCSSANPRTVDELREILLAVLETDGEEAVHQLVNRW